MSRYLAIYILVLFLIASCKTETCKVSCGGGTVYYVAMGFTKSELQGMSASFYVPNTGFTKFQFTDTLPPARFFYAYGIDSSNGIITIGAMTISDAMEEDIKLYVPKTNQTFEITKFTMAGQVSEQLPCKEGGTPGGSPVGPGCNGYPYLHSYLVNGTMVTLPQSSKPTDSFGYIYFHK